MKKRKLEIAVISDLYLGTHGCFTDELLTYLNSIDPNMLILNGGVMDVNRFKTNSFPLSHLNVIKKITSMVSKGTKVFYITGSQENMSSYATIKAFEGINFCEKLVLNLNGKKTWFFHGDILDTPLPHLRWIEKLGLPGYRMLFTLNKGVFWIFKKLKKEYPFFEKSKKNKGGGLKYISDFEQMVTAMAIDDYMDCVVCGHTCQPKKQYVETSKGSTLYLNSGDWLENMTALEYSFNRWKLYRYKNDKLSPFFTDEALKDMDMGQLIASIDQKAS